ncbi:DUF1206 domain-containing protein [Actinomadura flavalba]|uniref:DUF1206 domain-containing protein n=1 Tax=Actinomadura flavalba TaxID=1120938 RepID=UPI000476B053|nr:DUF1206 domain-containing protein [Actinomadura flavalba]
MAGHAQRAKGTGRQVAGSPWFHKFSRAGLAARGVIYLLIGFIAVQIGLGDSGKEADRSGALGAVADKPGGMIILWVVVIAFLGLALWRFSEAAFGQPLPDGHKPVKRLTSLARGIVYTALFAGMLGFLLGHGAQSSDKQSQTFTAKAMDAPLGRWLVLAVGLGFLAYGVGNIVTSAKHKFLEKLKTGEMSPQQVKVVKILGMVGGIARGLVFGGVGVFISYAAITFDPEKAKGLDGTLREFADTPAGPWLLILVAIGVAVYGAYCFAEARWRKVEAAR